MSVKTKEGEMTTEEASARKGGVYDLSDEQLDGVLGEAMTLWTASCVSERRLMELRSDAMPNGEGSPIKGQLRAEELNVLLGYYEKKVRLQREVVRECLSLKGRG